MLETDRITGLDLIMADAISSKFLNAALTETQLKELIQIVPR